MEIGTGEVLSAERAVDYIYCDKDGDYDRVVVYADSFGNTPVAVYLTSDTYYGEFVLQDNSR